MTSSQSGHSNELQTKSVILTKQAKTFAQTMPPQQDNKNLEGTPSFDPENKTNTFFFSQTTAPPQLLQKSFAESNQLKSSQNLNS